MSAVSTRRLGGTIVIWKRRWKGTDDLAHREGAAMAAWGTAWRLAPVTPRATATHEPSTRPAHGEKGSVRRSIDSESWQEEQGRRSGDLPEDKMCRRGRGHLAHGPFERCADRRWSRWLGRRCGMQHGATPSQAANSKRGTRGG
jgi:hypothetical protein